MRFVNGIFSLIAAVIAVSLGLAGEERPLWYMNPMILSHHLTEGNSFTCMRG
jgi:hypothetical protein